MIYRDIDRCYLYQIAPKFPDNFVVNTTSPKEYGQKLLIESEVKMKENKHSLKISRSCGDITLDGYPIATYSNDELKILKNLLTKVLDEVNEYIKD